MKKLLVSAILLVAFAINSDAQSTATATATATIVTPISITKNVDINFGNVAVTASAGTVVLAPAGTRTPTGGVTLPSTVGTVTAGDFTVNGTAGYTYVITLPSTITLTRASGTETMTANNFLSSLGATGSIGTLTGGSQTFTLGATLNVNANQVAGVYASPAFNVTVNYN